MKLAYGIAFTVVLPVALFAWSVRLDHLVALPVIGSAAMGAGIAIAGALLAIAGVIALKVDGGGWPMSPFPPARRVSRGAYAVVANPIYAGSVLIAAGIAIALQSAAGLWIVTPILALTCAAFVAGYERDATVARFGEAPRPPLLRLPSGDDERPQIADRLSIYFLVLLPWLVAYEAVNALGIPAGARSGYGAWDARVPVIAWTEAVYFLDYMFVLAVPLAARTRRQLRDFALAGWIATAAVTLFYLAVPIAVIPKPVPLASSFAPLMIWERQMDAPVTAFPAFHVLWAAIAAAAFSRARPKLRVVWWTLAVAIAVSCVTTGMHAIGDVMAGFVAAALVLSHRRIRRGLLSIAERIANSWREWDLGAIRVLSHGVWAAAGAFFGILIAAALAGGALGAILFVGAAAIIGAALWAQWLEGSSQLLRPFGYYGGLLGGCMAIALTPEPWLILAAYGVAATVVQAFGRLRCLVQGCCHGRPAGDDVGIRYRHPRSRVTRLSDLAAQPLHCTQGYSIAANAVVFVILLRLWTAAAPLSLIAGMYFVLTGLGRFVEEHFRGEPQTRIVAGLRVYQWLAIASVIAGALLTCVASRPAPPPVALDPRTVVIAALFAFATYVAYGVDFPRLNRRFARLV
jgi:prolipoprotein diacylglyceryltransferase/protein-S-isoprenylcysteine O-methyltransferase Ste14